MTVTEKKERAEKVVGILKRKYPAAECELRYDGDPWRLLVMGRLSAQCTDKRVNIVSEELFGRFPTAEKMAEGDLAEIEKIVYPCGVYRVKAKNIKDMSGMIVNDFGGVVPKEMDELLKLPGVGRKIANLIIGDIYGLPAIVADTHCIRISNRLGLCTSKDPAKVEKQLSEIVPPEEQSDFCHRVVYLGREYCTARNPKCDVCPLKELCKGDTDKNKE